MLKYASLWDRTIQYVSASCNHTGLFTVASLAYAVRTCEAEIK